MEVFLIRHTAPDVTPGTIYGHLDVLPGPDFPTASLSVAAQLPLSFDVVYSSPSRRCRMLADTLQGRVIPDERLRELHFGSWEGRTWDSLTREESAAWMQDWIHTAPPGGETLAAMQARVLSFIHTLQQAPVQQAAVVTHAGVIRIILAERQGIPLQSMFSLEVRYGQVFRMQL